jgi:hypothetical protein
MGWVKLTAKEAAPPPRAMDSNKFALRVVVVAVAVEVASIIVVKEDVDTGKTMSLFVVQTTAGETQARRRKRHILDGRSVARWQPECCHSFHWRRQKYVCPWSSIESSVSSSCLNFQICDQDHWMHQGWYVWTSLISGSFIPRPSFLNLPENPQSQHYPFRLNKNNDHFFRR